MPVEPAARGERFARMIFRGAAIYGLIVLSPLYLLPLPERAPETTLGFIGLALVFQGVFWVIGGDPLRFRALMPLAVAEKLVFAVPAVVLFALGRTEAVVAGFAAVDILLAIGFIFALKMNGILEGEPE